MASSAQSGRGDYSSENQNANTARGNVNGSNGSGGREGADEYFDDENDIDGFGDLDQELDEVTFPHHVMKP